MNIWIIQTGELVPLSPGVRRMRSCLLALELARRGHSVTWWTSAFDHYSKSWLVDEDTQRTLEGGIALRLIRGLGYRRNVSIRRFADHAVVAWKFARAARKAARPDVIVAALPDYRIAHQAYRYAREHAIPFVVDLRDRWPWDFLPLLPSAARPLARVALARDFTMAAQVIREADGLATMMTSWIEWTRAKLGRSRERDDRAYYLGAERPAPAASIANPAVARIVREWNGKWIVLFVGAFTTRSAPLVVIEAAKKIGESAPALAADVRFVLAGDGDYMAELRERARGLDNVAFTGFIGDAEIAALLAISRAGVVTANADFPGVPNKVFTYLSGGLPLLSAISGELAELIAAEKLGLQYDDADALVAAIDRLHRDEPLRRTLSQHALEIFATRFDAAVIYREFADYVQACARLGAAPRRMAAVPGRT